MDTSKGKALLRDVRPKQHGSIWSRPLHLNAIVIVVLLARLTSLEVKFKYEILAAYRRHAARLARPLGESGCRIVFVHSTEAEMTRGGVKEKIDV